MKRIPRLRQPSAVLTQCLQTPTASSTHPAVSRAAAATTTTATTTTGCLARPRDFSTTPMPFRRSRPWAKEPAVTSSQPARNDEVYVAEADPLEETVSENSIDSDLVIPPSYAEPDLAPRSDDLEAGGLVDYKPAETAEGLEVVGGLTDWFNKDEHLPPSKLDSLDRFAPKTLVEDPAVLELCVRRAVVEALAVVQAKHGQLLRRSWGGRASSEAAERVQALGIKCDDGKATLTGEVREVVNDLAAKEKTEGASLATDVAYPESATAQAICAELSADWKKVSLKDVKFRFAVLKRVFQLTGHRISDAKILDLDKASDLLAHVVKPPAPRSVYETIQQVGVLPNLPNVEVHEKRRTPITEAEKVGSWKIMKEILEKRNLPVTGHQGVGKFVEDDWFRGPRVVKKKRSRRT